MSTVGVCVCVCSAPYWKILQCFWHEDSEAFGTVRLRRRRVTQLNGCLQAQQASVVLENILTQAHRGHIDDLDVLIYM